MIPNTLEAMQMIVGGYIETVNFPGGIILVCNEEGKFEGLPPNLYYRGGMIVGTVFFASNAGEDFQSLSDEQIRGIQYLCRQNEVEP